MRYEALALALAASLGGSARAQMMLSSDVPGGPQLMEQAKSMEKKKEVIESNKMVGLMDRALNRMAAAETKELNVALLERGSLVSASGEVIKANEAVGEQVIDPRTPTGFGNPFNRKINVEQNIKVNNLMNDFELKMLNKAKKEGTDVRVEASTDIEAGTGWVPFISEGSMKARYAQRNAEFMPLLEVSPNKIIRRICESCDDAAFKDIYYRRMTDTYSRNLLTMMKDGPFDNLDYGGTTNECFVDFTLHSSYEDAKTGANPWSHCHPSPNTNDRRHLLSSKPLGGDDLDELSPLVMTHPIKYPSNLTEDEVDALKEALAADVLFDADADNADDDAEAVARRRRKLTHNSIYGFPSYSGPNAHNPGPAGINRGSGGESDYAFYVEESEWIPVVGTYRLNMMDNALEKERMAGLDEALAKSVNGIVRRVCSSCADTYKDVFYKRTGVMAPIRPATDGWVQAEGSGTLDDAVPMSRFSFVTSFRNTPNKIVKRVCASCAATHREIFYKRLTDVPDSMDFLDLFLNNWRDNNNRFNRDFELYSTYDDALTGTNKWTYCNFDKIGVGFPRDCGPTSRTFNQWNAFAKSEGQENVGFYLEEASATSGGTSIRDIDKILLRNFQPYGVDGNIFRTDFDIFSTYDDAKAGTNPWEYCPFAEENEYGFPGNCKPKTTDANVNDQWNRICATGYKCAGTQADTAFYVEEESEFVENDDWMSKDEEMATYFLGKASSIEQEDCAEPGKALANNLGVSGMTAVAATTEATYYSNPNWFSNPYDTWEDSRSNCIEKGMELCPRSVACPNGAGKPPFGDAAKEGDQWIAVIDEPNSHVQVGTWAGNEAEASDSDCDADQEPWHLRIQLDNAPAELYWQLSSSVDGVIDYKYGYPNQANALLDFRKCLKRNVAYHQFYIWDPTSRDGLCCNDGKGWYEMSFGGKTHRGDKFTTSAGYYDYYRMAPTQAQAVQTYAAGESNAETCTEHEERHGTQPLWGLYGESYWRQQSGKDITFVDYSLCCSVQTDLKYDPYAGYYDVQRCGGCQDYCFWMTDDDSGVPYQAPYKALANPRHMPVAYDTSGNVKAYFTCVLAGSETTDKSTDVDFLDRDGSGFMSFPYRKCTGRGQSTPDYLPNEFLGCYNHGLGAFEEQMANGKTFTLGQCSDACSSKNYHYFGRQGSGQCYCAGRTLDDLDYKRHGAVEYGASNYCACDENNIGSNVNCVYRIRNQFDPVSARKQNPCIHLSAGDLRKLCYISCRDKSRNMNNMFMCNMLKTKGMMYLSRKIQKWYNEGGKGQHLLGDDVAAGGGTF